MSSVVPNQFPSLPPDGYRLALVGEAPGETEEKVGKPFMGMSGRVLDDVLSRCNIMRARCFVGNVCQIRPPANDITKFAKDGPEITEGLKRLAADLTLFAPNLIVLLGKTALWAAKGTMDLGSWRGSVFKTDRFGPSFKCLATYHPAACIRMYEFMPLFNLDMRRAQREAFYPDLRLPQRDLITNLSFDALIQELDNVITRLLRISVDIEGGVNTLSCLSIATSRSKSFIVPFERLDGSSYWKASEEAAIWQRIGRIMADSQIEKIWQNGLYDRFVLQHSYACLVRNSAHDTMLKWWENYCELEKALSVQASILTDEPYYKFERKTEDQQTFFEYCCKDSAVTFEINEKLEPLLDDEQHAHYKFNNALLNSLLYMELRGIRYDQERADERLAEMRQHVWSWQEQLDNVARELGVLNGLDFNQPLLPQVQAACCYKRDPTQPKKAFVEAGYYSAIELCRCTSLTQAERGQLSTLCGLSMNTKSKFFKDFLYKTCKLPTQWKEDPKTKEQKVTTDYEALLKLSKFHDHPALRCSLELSRLRTRSQMLAVRSYMGRMHTSYNLVGSETGRVTSSKSALWSGDKRVGLNMQTVSDDWDIEDDHPLAEGLRNLYIADEGCYLGKCDLRGADGWTVGAYMAMLGDRTMLDDLLFGIKPAQVVAYIIKFGATEIQKYAQDRETLKTLLSKIKKEDWEYFVAKQIIWGSCYTMGPRKAAERVLIESDGKVNLSESETKQIQAAIFIRYRVRTWHNWMQNHLGAQRYPAKLVAPNGFTRKFFGRRTEILGKALAHMPQVITTYATLKAAHRLWTDPSNRLPVDDGRDISDACLLRVEPLHQVHDELLVQFKIEDTQWALSALKQWFNNPIVVAGQTLVIPFDGSYGTSWAMDEKSKVGEIK